MDDKNKAEFIPDEEAGTYTLELTLSSHINDEAELHAYMNDALERIQAKYEAGELGEITQAEFESYVVELVEFYILTKDR